MTVGKCSFSQWLNIFCKKNYKFTIMYGMSIVQSIVSQNYYSRHGATASHSPGLHCVRFLFLYAPRDLLYVVHYTVTKVDGSSVRTKSNYVLSFFYKISINFIIEKMILTINYFFCMPTMQHYEVPHPWNYVLSFFFKYR